MIDIERFEAKKRWFVIAYLQECMSEENSSDSISEAKVYSLKVTFAILVKGESRSQIVLLNLERSIASPVSAMALCIRGKWAAI